MKYYRNKVRKLQSQISDLNLKLANKRSELDRSNREIDRCRYIKSVYGKKGVRLCLLSSALSALSRVATYVIQAVRGTGVVVVEANSDFTAIDLKVDFGDGFVTYNGLSVGEQSSVDFAILKALSALPGKGKYTLPYVYDDVFDSLDDSVKSGVVSVIESEGVDNQVFVLSHDDNVVELFDKAKVYRVEDGSVSFV